MHIHVHTHIHIYIIHICNYVYVYIYILELPGGFQFHNHPNQDHNKIMRLTTHRFEIKIYVLVFPCSETSKNNPPSGFQPNHRVDFDLSLLSM